MNKAFYKKIAVLAMLVCAGASAYSNGVFTTKVAKARGHVACYCAFWGGNEKCSASNGGSLCASGENIQCSGWNSNCDTSTPPAT